MNNRADVTVALVPIARTTFDMGLAEQVMQAARSQLAQTGLSLIGPETLLTDIETTRQVIQTLGADPPDLVILLQASFADSSMVLEIARQVEAPLLLWAVPEAHTGGRLRLNSLCGINLAGHALTRAGYGYEHLYAAPGDPAVLQKLQPLAQAAAVRRRLRHSRLGRLGQHPAGFETCAYDPERLKRQLGIEVVELELPQLFEQVKLAEPQQVEAAGRRLSQTLANLSQLDPSATQGTLATYVTLRHLADQEHLDGLAVRCWPEFFTQLGCAACGALSMLSDEQTPCSCEADVNGTITQLILQWLSGEPAFGSDLVSIDPDQDGAVLWHCGLAPLAMADPTVPPQGTIHSNRKLPLLLEFPLKPGRVTVARLSEATGSYRLVVGGGEMLQAPPSFSGTTGLLRFDRPVQEVMDTILGEGLEHHLSITYGEHQPALLALARLLKIPVLQL
jgi:L-fucose isomerase-like protein